MHLKARLRSLLESLTRDDERLLTQARSLSEEVVGTFPLPLSLVRGVRINSREASIVPLVTEEASVVIGLATALRALEKGGSASAWTSGRGVIGQIHFCQLQNASEFAAKIVRAKDALMRNANQGPCASMSLRGGGVFDVQVRDLAHDSVAVYVLIDSIDAMGANVTNQTCEFLSRQIEEDTGAKALMAVISNYNPSSLTHARVQLSGLSRNTCQRIVLASEIATADPYRAVTHNKGVMNGIDALCVATCNDWRAVEANLHAYASSSGSYQPICTWTYKNDELVGEFCAPIRLGIVGGAINSHPIAQAALRCLNVQSQMELSELAAVIGLMQNFAALRTLTTEGIARGYTKAILAKTAASARTVDELMRMFDAQGYLPNSAITSVRNV